MKPLDPQSFALGCLVGGVVAFVGAAAIGGWLERRKGPRAVMVRYLPRDPETDAWVKMLNGDLYDRQPDDDPVVKALMAGHQAKKTRLQ